MLALQFPDFDPVLIQIGPLAIRWYALAYIAGLLGGWWYILRLLKTQYLWDGPPFNGKPQVTADHIGDLFVWAALGVIAGGRLGYVLFYGLIYEWDHFAEAPWRVFAAWEGGMSFHGGAIGVVLAIIFFARAKKLDMVALGDLVAVAAPIGLFFGRIANFVNGELWGKVSTAPWAMVFPSDPKQLPRHPSQLYEAALEGLVLFIILHVMIHRFNALRRPGLVIAVMWAGYGLFRFLVEEFFRENSHQSLGIISMGALLSIAMFIFAAVFFWYSLYRKGPALQTQ
ncbi:MAG: prolipoprotein diacylglyceryl transferase [Alphaproteobacteria bacterium]|jgi:phosphatidylglycerol:prolipoprotein diacylglycerol transferase|nr:prolipoprotein diacylglyceryl transferase [Alphaproteobacteria bacterium]